VKEEALAHWRLLHQKKEKKKKKYVIAPFQWQSFAYLEIIKERKANSVGLMHYV
jgi:hypothetical protein